MRSERQTRGGATRFETREENGKKKIEVYNKEKLVKEFNEKVDSILAKMK